MANQNQLISNQDNIQILDEPIQVLPILSFLNKAPPQRKPLNSVQVPEQECAFEVEVVNHKIVDKQFTIYQVKISYGSLYWVFQTRYSLLESLNSKLDKSIQKRIARFPEKKLFGSLEESFVEKRKNELNQYLKSLFKLGRNEQPVKQFIRQSQKAAVEINDPCELKHFKL